NSVLEQVTDAADAVRQELGRVLALHVLAEHEDRRSRDKAPRLDRGQKPLVTLARGHPDVDHRHVGPMLRDRLDERATIADLRNDGPPGLLDEPGDAFTNEHGVLRDDDADWLALHPEIMPHRRTSPSRRGRCDRTAARGPPRAAPSPRTRTRTGR